jgi:prepilin-type N-terminal cleavage/methylation domain-containing protein
MVANKTTMQDRMRQRWGFTLTEMMIVILVIGLMAAITTPPLFRFIQSNRLQTNTDRVVADLQFARSLSISNGRILRFTADQAGYQVTDPLSGDVLREKNFDRGLSLDAEVTVDFFPWGMADATVLTLSNRTGDANINILPTGIVEVH